MQSKKVVAWIALAVAVMGVGYLVTRPAGPVMQNVDNAKAQQLIGEGVRVIDVRTAEEFSAGHLPDAENVAIDELPTIAKGWDRDGALLLYCATGVRSLNGARWLQANGFRKVYNLTNGITQWDGEVTTVSSGGPVNVETNGKPVFIEFSSNG